MSDLLEKAIAEARKLPASEQNELAALILAEIEDDHRWEAAFADSKDKLDRLAKKARQQVDEGRCRSAGFDDL